jgi:hypothetical protein
MCAKIRLLPHFDLDVDLDVDVDVVDRADVIFSKLEVGRKG